ncbi:MAG: metal-dependent hydrolase [Patescibacteria group bacterium]
MTGRTHDMAAFVALSVITLTHPLPEITLATGIAALVANMIGGIAPDIDQPTAPFWRNLPIGGYVGRTLTRLLGGHRFLSHSIVGIFLFGLGWHYFLQFITPLFPDLNMSIIWWAFMIGFVSHLVMDTFTREGVPWLLPIPIKFGFPPHRNFRVETGEFVERFVVFPGLIVFNMYWFYLHYATIQILLHHYLK